MGGARPPRLIRPLLLWCHAGRHDRHVLTSRSNTLLSGAFLIAFDDERAALDAARECRSVNFVADVSRQNGGWLISASRKNLFPADERDRYESRLKRIVEPFGGRYDRFVPG